MAEKKDMTLQKRRERKRQKRKQKNNSIPTSSLSREQLHKKNMIEFKNKKVDKEDMKAIAWLNQIFILGDNCLITVGGAGVQIQNESATFIIKYVDDPNIAKRISEDKIFAEMIGNIGASLLMQFLNSQVNAFSFATDLFNVKIEVPTTVNNGIPNEGLPTEEETKEAVNAN